MSRLLAVLLLAAASCDACDETCAACVERCAPFAASACELRYGPMGWGALCECDPSYAAPKGGPK